MKNIPQDAVRLKRYAKRARSGEGSVWGRIEGLFHRLVFKAMLLKVFLSCIFRYDVFIFSAGTSFFSGIELWLLRSLGKKILFIYLGSESRPPYLNGIFLTRPQWQGYWHLKKLSKHIAHRVRRQERVSNAIIAHRVASQFLRRPFYDYLAIGYPMDPLPPVCDVMQSGDHTVVVHAPSLPAIKGSTRIREIVGRIQKRHAIHFVELIGKTNAEVLEQLRSCDLVIDELYSDSVLGGLGVEAASFGKPTLVSGYAQSEQISPLESRDCWPPSEYCHPSEFERCFVRLLEDVPYRRVVGNRAHEFVARYWSPSNVAQRIVGILSGTAAMSWIVQPTEIRYFRGYGIEEAALQDKLREYLHRFGPEALMLSHHRELRDAICTFAQGEPCA
jgi:glycosyltransferase involved in cell wall biosynthesis